MARLHRVALTQGPIPVGTREALKPKQESPRVPTAAPDQSPGDSERELAHHLRQFAS